MVVCTCSQVSLSVRSSSLAWSQCWTGPESGDETETIWLLIKLGGELCWLLIKDKGELVWSELSTESCGLSDRSTIGQELRFSVSSVFSSGSPATTMLEMVVVSWGDLGTTKTVESLSLLYLVTFGLVQLLLLLWLLLWLLPWLMSSL